MATSSSGVHELRLVGVFACPERGAPSRDPAPRGEAALEPVKKVLTGWKFLEVSIPE
jgi:hypothetical protein